LGPIRYQQMTGGKVTTFLGLYASISSMAELVASKPTGCGSESRWGLN
jgi:hypothetical protein